MIDFLQQTKTSYCEEIIKFQQLLLQEPLRNGWDQIRFNNMHLVIVHHGLQNSTCTCGCLSLCANPITGTF